MAYRALDGSDCDEFRALRRLGLERYPENFLLTVEEHDARGAEVDHALLQHGNMRGMFEDNTLIALAGLVRAA